MPDDEKLPMGGIIMSRSDGTTFYFPPMAEQGTWPRTELPPNQCTFGMLVGCLKRMELLEPRAHEPNANALWHSARSDIHGMAGYRDFEVAAYQFGLRLELRDIEAIRREIAKRAKLTPNEVNDVSLTLAAAILEGRFPEGAERQNHSGENSRSKTGVNPAKPSMPKRGAKKVSVLSQIEYLTEIRDWGWTLPKIAKTAGCTARTAQRNVNEDPETKKAWNNYQFETRQSELRQPKRKKRRAQK
jgi:hypothetical protein